MIEVLQTFALPLGHGAIFKSDSYGNRTRVTAVKGRCLDRLTKEPRYEHLDGNKVSVLRAIHAEPLMRTNSVKFEFSSSV